MAEPVQTSTPGSEAEPEAAALSGGKKQRPRSFWRELPILLIVAVVAALLVRTFLVQSFWIPSGSMENTLERGDRVVVNKVVYELRSPERGEVIVFKAPLEWRGDPEDEDFIKRVVAVGGDVVSYDAESHLLLVNGTAVDESAYLYVDPADGARDLPSKDDYEFSAAVPEGRLWVMGDHRSSSGDSRENYIRSGGDVMRATIPESDVVGKAFALMWPMERWSWLGQPEVFEKVPDPSEAPAT